MNVFGNMKKLAYTNRNDVCTSLNIMKKNYLVHSLLKRTKNKGSFKRKPQTTQKAMWIKHRFNKNAFKHILTLKSSAPGECDSMYHVILKWYSALQAASEKSNVLFR